MNAIAEALAERGTSARNLLALQFGPERGLKVVMIGGEPHPATYPSLEDIFEMVCNTCEQDGIIPSELERITFFDTEINLECAHRGEEVVYTYPLPSTTVH